MVLANNAIIAVPKSWKSGWAGKCVGSRGVIYSRTGRSTKNFCDLPLRSSARLISVATYQTYLYVCRVGNKLA